MSQENVELARRTVDAWHRRDVEAVIALWDPECVFYPALEVTTEGSTYRGHAGVRQYFEDLATWLSEGHMEYEDFRALGDQVLGLGRARLKFASGIELEQEIAFVQTWRNGKVVEMRSWFTHAKALEAVGLSE